jgi:hypothetical protein
MKNKYTPRGAPIIIDNPPTPDAERIMKLVSFAFESLAFLEQTKVLYDEVHGEMPEGTPKGNMGVWVDKLVGMGLECFPLTEAEKAKAKEEIIKND